MSLNFPNYTGNGSTTDYSFSFPYLDRSHVKVSVNGTPTTAFTFHNATTIRFNTAPADGALIVIYRETPSDSLLGDFSFGGAIREQDLEDTLNQVLFVAQETEKIVESSDSGSLASAVAAANATAATANSTANNAQDVANGISGTASSALTTANAAVATADAAALTANAAAAAAAAAAPVNSPTFTGTPNLPNLNGGSLAGLRNRIINGDFRVDQRHSGNSFTVTNGFANTAYRPDRWYIYATGGDPTGQRITVAGSQVDPNRMQFTGASGVTAIGIGQRIEAANCRDLAGTTATLSVNLSNSSLTTVNWQAFYANTNDAFGPYTALTRTSIASGSFTVNSTYSRYSTQISIPAAATTGIEIVFTVGAQTSGTWAVGQVQLEPGSVATPFERRPLGLEELLCQRYFISGRSSATLNTQSITANVSFSTFYPVRMRVNPTVTGWTTSYSTVYGWTGFQNVAGLSWAGDTNYTADAEL